MSKISWKERSKIFERDGLAEAGWIIRGERTRKITIKEETFERLVNGLVQNENISSFDSLLDLLLDHSGLGL